MCDSLDRNVPSHHNVVESNCLSHGWRDVVDEVENFPDECRYVLEALGKVFKNEATCRRLGLSGQGRLAFHQCESGPVMASLERWLKTELEQRHPPPAGLSGTDSKSYDGPGM